MILCNWNWIEIKTVLISAQDGCAGVNRPSVRVGRPDGQDHFAVQLDGGDGQAIQQWSVIVSASFCFTDRFVMFLLFMIIWHFMQQPLIYDSATRPSHLSFFAFVGIRKFFSVPYSHA